MIWICSLILVGFVVTTSYTFILQALETLNSELEVVKSAMVGSFVDPWRTAIGRHKSGGGVSEQPRDPDVWPPPTPQEPRYLTHSLCGQDARTKLKLST